MGTPSTGYDLSKQLAGLKAKSDASVAAATTALTQSNNESLLARTVSNIGTTLEKSAANVARSASEKLQQQLSGKTAQVSALAQRASNLQSAAAKLGENGNRLPGVAGELTKAAGGASKLGGLASLLSSGKGAQETAAAAKSATSVINANLADTMFTALPTDDVLVVDAYGIRDNTVLNSVVGKLTGFAKDSFAGLGGLAGVGRTVTSALVAGKGGLNLNTDVLKDRVLSALGGRTGVFNALSGSLQSGLTTLGLPAGVYDEVEATIGGIRQYITTGGVNDARSTFDLISRITGQSGIADFLDVGAEATLMATVFREAIDMRVPDAISAMLEKSKSEQASYYALQSNIVVAANMSDLQTLDQMVTTLGAERVRLDCPDAVSRVLSGYRFAEGTTVADYPDRFNELNAVCAKVDVNWGYVQRGDERLTSTASFVQLSADARTLLSNAGPFQDIIQMGSSYPSIDLVAGIKANYPYALM